MNMIKSNQNLYDKEVKYLVKDEKCAYMTYIKRKKTC